MEPEVHIIEKWFQEVQRCFTMTNIQLKGKKEVDLLAIEPSLGECYHVESIVSTSFKLRLNATYTKSGRCHKNGMDYFYKEKFNHHTVKQFVNGIFNNKDYRQIIVVWDTKEDLRELNEKCKKDMGIEIWSIKGIINDLCNHRVTVGSRDDILRTMELVFLEKKWEKELDNMRARENTL